MLAALIIAGCSRSHPNQYGLKVPHTASSGQFGNNGANANGYGENGPATPGSMKEFTSRIGDTVYFSTDSSRLDSKTQTTLSGQAHWLNQYPQYGITIEGHADERGTREYNIALGARRAAAVKRFLITRGVSARRIKTISYGRERPVALCANIKCWSRNRRAVTVLNGYSATASY
ncbi:MAG: peptidoglycan-associated lipoprotein Pal [Alphaproteobacteria bacterium]